MTPLVMLNNIRSPNFPDVPTLAETGYHGPPSRSWYGLFTPAGTPRPIIDKLAKEVASIVDDPAFPAKHLSARSLCRRPTRRRSSRPKSGTTARWPSRWSRTPAWSRNDP